MKTKEVIKELEKMNLETEMIDNILYVVHPTQGDVASINLDEKFAIDTNYVTFRKYLTKYEQEKVYVLLTKLAETDPKDREEKKYYLKHRWLLPDDYRYLYKDDLECILIEKIEPSNNCVPFYEPTKFTKKQIEELKREFNTKLEDFEMVEVEDD